MNDAQERLDELRRLTAAKREAEHLEAKAASVHLKAKARRREAELAVSRWLQADAEPCPLFDGPGATPGREPAVSPEAEAGGDDEDDRRRLEEEAAAEPATWNVCDGARKAQQVGTVVARNYGEARQLAEKRYPAVHPGALLVSRDRPAPQQWDGASDAPDAWRSTGVGLALPELPAETVRKLGAAGLAAAGELWDAFQCEALPTVKGLKTPQLIAIQDALDVWVGKREGGNP